MMENDVSLGDSGKNKFRIIFQKQVVQLIIVFISRNKLRIMWPTLFAIKHENWNLFAAVALKFSLIELSRVQLLTNCKSLRWKRINHFQIQKIKNRNPKKILDFWAESRTTIDKIETETKS